MAKKGFFERLFGDDMLVSKDSPAARVRANKAEGERRRARTRDFSQTREGRTKQDPQFLANPRKYKVKSGDTLSQIARDYGVSLQSVLKANDIKDANKIRAGANLIIPGGKKPKATDVYEGTSKSDMEKMSMGRTREQVASRSAANTKAEGERRASVRSERGLEKPEGSKYSKGGKTVKNMAGGGSCRGMGAASRGGKYSVK